MRALLELRLVCRALVSSANRCVPALEAVAFADLSVSVPEEELKDRTESQSVVLGSIHIVCDRVSGLRCRAVGSPSSDRDRELDLHDLQVPGVPPTNKTEKPQDRVGTACLLVQGSKRKIVCVRRSPLAQRREAVLVK